LDSETARKRTVLVVQCSLNVIDSGIWHSASLEDLQPLLRGLLLGDVLDQSIDIGAMLHAITVGDEASIGLPLWESESIAQHTKQSVVTATEKNVTVGSLVAPVRYNRS
jgi:hypothetical protein